VTVEEGQSVSYTITPPADYAIFIGEESKGVSHSETVTVTADTTIAVEYVKMHYTLIINSATGGSTSPSAGIYDVQYLSSEFLAKFGQPPVEVTITAIPNTGYGLAGWEGASSVNEDGSAIVKMDEDEKTVRATFVQTGIHKLTLTANSYCSVSAEPALSLYMPGQEVTITATYDEATTAFVGLVELDSEGEKVALHDEQVTITMDVDRYFKGLAVPESMLFSNESPRIYVGMLLTGGSGYSVSFSEGPAGVNGVIYCSIHDGDDREITAGDVSGIPDGASLYFAIIAPDGYNVKEVKVDGGDSVGSGATVSGSISDINENHSVAIEYEIAVPVYHQLTITAEPPGGGIMSPAAGVYEYISHDFYELMKAENPGVYPDDLGDLTVTATPGVINIGYGQIPYTFVNWTGDITETSQEISVPMPMPNNISITANFVASQIQLDVVNGTIVGVGTSGTYDYQAGGVSVDIEADPDTTHVDKTFHHWTASDGSIADARDRSTSVTLLNANVTATAVFLAPTYTIDLSKTGNGSISISERPPIVEKVSDTRYTVQGGESVSVDMSVDNAGTLDADHYITSVEVDGSPVTLPPSGRIPYLTSYTHTFSAVNDNHDVSVTFEHYPVIITTEVTLIGGASGSISASGAVISSRPDASDPNKKYVEVESGGSVDFIITPAGGSGISVCSVDIGTHDARTAYTHTMTNITDVSIISASFQKTATLTASSNNEDRGTVSVDPEPDNGLFYWVGDTPTEVTVTATPTNENFVFSIWSGVDSGQDTRVSPAKVTMAGDKSVTANFAPLDKILIWYSVNNPEWGSIEALIEDVPAGTGGEVEGTVGGSVTINITPNPDDENCFIEDVEIDNDPVGRVTSHTFSNLQVGETHTAHAIFGKKGVSGFTLLVRSTSGGRTDHDPEMQRHPAFSEVTVTATPNSEYEFDYWTGDASGSANQVTILMDGNKEILAHFIEDSGGGGGDTTPPTVPQNLRAVAVSKSQINLTWSPSTDDDPGVERYHIHRDGHVVHVTLGSTSYQDNRGLLPATKYSYYVTAEDGDGNRSGPSNTAEATTFADGNNIGRGATNAFYIDNDGDGFGVGAPAGPDADDSDASVNTTPTVEATYGDLDNLNNMRTFLRNALGYGSGGGIYFIATNGDDATGEAGNPNRPFRTWRVGVRPLLQPGDIVMYRQGVHIGDALISSVPSGAPVAPILVMAYPGESATLGGSSVAIACVDASYLIFDGLILEDAGSSIDGVTVKGGRNITIKNMEIKDYGRGIRCYEGLDYIMIETCVIHDNDGMGVYFLESADLPHANLAVRDSIIYNNNGNAIEHNGRVDNLIVDYNIIHSNSGSALWLSNGVSYSTIRNNIIFNNTKHGIELTQGTADGVVVTPYSQDYNLFVNNIIWQGSMSPDGSSITGGLPVVFMDDKTPTGAVTMENNDFVNNIFVSYNGPIFCDKDQDHITSSIIMHNVFYKSMESPDDIILESGEGSGAETYNLTEFENINPTDIDNNAFLDPEFADVSLDYNANPESFSFKYSEDSQSPAINLGDYTDACAPTFDLLALEKDPYPDAGCYEFEGAPTNIYTIMSLAGPGGYIYPSWYLRMAQGSSVNFEITPDTGYQIANVTVDGQSQGVIQSRNFSNVNSDHTIEAIFSAGGDAYILNVVNGRISATGLSSGAYLSGEVVDIAANPPQQGYIFMEWTGDVLDMDDVTNPATFITISDDATVTAEYEYDGTSTMYTVTINPPPQNGTVSKDPDKAEYNEGEQPTLRPEPDYGYRFDRWEGEDVPSGREFDNPLYLSMTGTRLNKTLTAIFVESAAGSHIIQAIAGAGGTITPSGNVEVEDGGNETFTITPNSGYHIDDVLIDDGSMGPLQSFPFSNVTRDRKIEARFAANAYVLNVINGSIVGGGTSGTYDYGEVVPIRTNTPPAGQVFSHWSGDVADIDDINSSVTTITMRNSATVTANFTSGSTVSLTINIDGDGTTVPPAGVHTYNANELASVDAIEGASSEFTGWDLDGNGTVDDTNDPLILMMDSNKTVTAKFEPLSGPTYYIAVTATGGGSVSPTPGLDGRVSVAQGADKEFTITADAGYYISQILVDGAQEVPNTPSYHEYTFSGVDSNHTLDVEFAAESSHQIRIEVVEGYRFGYVASVYELEHEIREIEFVQAPHNQYMQFMAMADAGYLVSEVVVDGEAKTIAPGTSVYVVPFPQVTDDHEVVVRFELDTGTGMFLSTSSASGRPGDAGIEVYIDIGDIGVMDIYGLDLTLDYDSDLIEVQSVVAGEAVPLSDQWTLGSSSDGTGKTRIQALYMPINPTPEPTAFPALGGQLAKVRFYVKDTAPAGQYSTLSFSRATANEINIPRIRIGVFCIEGTPQTTYSLAVNAVNGIVNRIPDINRYAPNQEVFLEALPSQGYEFVYWSGDLSGSTNPAVITMNSNKSVTANFNPVGAQTHTITASAGTGGSITPAGSVTVDEGANRTFTIQADPDYQIRTLYIDGVPGDYPAGYTSETYTFYSVTSDHRINIVFESTSTGPTYYNLTLNANAGMGSIAASPQQAQYVDGTPVQLTATPYSGYTFSGWSGDLSGSSALPQQAKAYSWMSRMPPVIRVIWIS